jgi:hypothetical protein
MSLWFESAAKPAVITLGEVSLKDCPMYISAGDDPKFPTLHDGVTGKTYLPAPEASMTIYAKKYEERDYTTGKGESLVVRRYNNKIDFDQIVDAYRVVLARNPKLLRFFLPEMFILQKYVTLGNSGFFTVHPAYTRVKRVIHSEIGFAFDKMADLGYVYDVDTTHDDIEMYQIVGAFGEQNRQFHSISAFSPKDRYRSEHRDSPDIFFRAREMTDYKTKLDMAEFAYTYLEMIFVHYDEGDEEAKNYASIILRDIQNDISNVDYMSEEDVWRRLCVILDKMLNMISVFPVDAVNGVLPEDMLLLKHHIDDLFRTFACFDLYKESRPRSPGPESDLGRNKMSKGPTGQSGGV